MELRDAEVACNAGALLRGDLHDLLPDDAERVDALLAEALAMAREDPIGAAESILSVVDEEPSLGARLSRYQQGTMDGYIAQRGVAGNDLSGFAPPPGNQGRIQATAWTCPLPLVHFRRLQRFPDQDMGLCPTHEVPLVMEDPS